MTITLRSTKGQALTHDELDANFTTLQTADSDHAALTAAHGVTGDVVGTTDTQTLTNKTLTSPSIGSGVTVSSGNIVLSGTGQKILINDVGASVADRTTIQNGTTNGTTSLQIAPNGTSTTSLLSCFNNSDVANSGRFNFSMQAAAAVISADLQGTGAYVPLQFATGGGTRMTLDTSGNLGIAVTPSVARLEVLGTDKTSIAEYVAELSTSSATTNAGRILFSQRNTYGVAYAMNSTSTTSAFMDMQWIQRSDGALQSTPMRLNYDGSVEFKSNKFGYGSGAGGTVTQLTNKGTSVTLNKASGQITTAADSMGAGTNAQFVVNNSLVTATDVVVVNISNSANYVAQCRNVAAGSFAIRLTNITAGSLSEAVLINFAIIKCSTT